MQLYTTINNWIVNRVSFLLWLLLVLLNLTACNNQGVVVFSPTEAPPGSQGVHFQHPSGIFSLDVPDDWAIYVQDSNVLAAAFFTPPGALSPALEVAAIELEGAETTEALSSIISDYIEILQSHGKYISEQDRQQMPDGSWRIAAIRTNVAGDPEAINTFIMQQDTTLLVANVRIPEDTNTQAQLERAINSVTLTSSSALSPASLDIIASLNSGPIMVTNSFSWSTPAGIYFVTGEVTNISSQTVNNVPVHVRLLMPDGETTAESQDVTMGLALAPGHFAPFSLRFGQGLPDESSTYILTLGNDDWRNTMTSTPEVAIDALSWDSESSVTAEGHLVISGTVTNTSEADVQDIVAVITVFDADENVIAAGFVETSPSSLAPGEEASFTIQISEMGNAPENFIVDVQGMRS